MTVQQHFARVVLITGGIALVIGSICFVSRRIATVSTDTVVTVQAAPGRIDLVDANGDVVGSLDFADQITVTIKRRTP